LCGSKRGDRDRLAAARELLDSGFDRALQAGDLIMMGRKLSEPSAEELIALNARLVSSGAVGDTEQPDAEAVH
jgi:hypothetical protein